jgi:hypothetical protein
MSTVAEFKKAQVEHGTYIDLKKMAQNFRPTTAKF